LPSRGRDAIPYRTPEFRAADTSASTEPIVGTPMPKTLRAASFAAALTLALVTLPALALASTAHGHAAAGQHAVSADGIGWDAVSADGIGWDSVPAAAVAAPQASGIGRD
jgi:hypothetical protein